MAKNQTEKIVGELVQPGGVRGPKRTWYDQAINHINAQPVSGYTVMYNGEQVNIEYSHKSKRVAH